MAKPSENGERGSSEYVTWQPAMPPVLHAVLSTNPWFILLLIVNKRFFPRYSYLVIAADSKFIRRFSARVMTNFWRNFSELHAAALE